MTISAILPIAGVPEELLRAINDRFRSIETATAIASAAVPGIFFLAKNKPDANGTAVGTFGAATDTGQVWQVQTVGASQIWVSVIGPHGAAVTSPTGGGTGVSAPSGGGVIDVQARSAIGGLITAVSSAGATVDTQARTAIDAIRARLSAYGVIV